MDDTHPHTQSFEDAIAITPESSQAYRVNLSSDWAIGDGESLDLFWAERHSMGQLPLILISL